MIYIYNDYGGTHTTALAAAYHLKKIIQSERELTKEEILNVNYFNKLTKKDFGNIIFHGIDENGDPVYTIGRKSSKLVVPAMKNLILLIQSKHQFHEQIIFSNTSPTVPLAMSIGGFFSRGLKIDFIGVPLLVIGAKQCCDNIFRLVENTKQIAQNNKDQVIILENNEYK
ncbi:hypothetical protein HMPREF1210_02988 [Paenisporosarcina sp. HGH0030]|uniref:DUF3189 family protein n=1 Tax=Paenisporosarcina sp. HGH0030 TaxID=1078085 RepID=UPI00034E1946|nr:DUF3189 family protein [Paenisporosarcina sp. HGH0030]EPD50140.1 hypothetical protein HMPREF1210_02988 [Paenisporosarcina sp. HGH0030]